jgi:ketosteroid isomerase-like protein
VSQDNVEHVRRGFAAFARGDREESASLLAPDAEFRPAMAGVLGRSVYRGREAVLRLLFEEQAEVLDGFAAELVEVEDLGGDAVLAVARFRGRARTGGLDVEQTFAQIHRVRDGQTLEMRAYPTVAEARRAAAE